MKLQKKKTVHKNQFYINPPATLKNKFDVFIIFKQKIHILLFSEIKTDNTFPVAQFHVERYSTPYRLNRTFEEGDIHLTEDIPLKQAKLKPFETSAL